MISRVGVVGRGVPLELLDAAGLQPRRVVGDPRADRAEADRWLGRGIDPLANAVLAGLLADGFASYDALVVANDSEVSLRLYYVLRELCRVDPALGVPPVHLLEVLHLDRPVSRAYTRAEFARFGDLLADWTGAPVPPGALSAAITAREAARTGLAARRPDLDGAGFLARRLGLDGVPSTTVRTDTGPAVGPRVVLSGSTHDEPGVTAAIEATGMRVVGDDHAGGELGLGRTAAQTTLHGLADRYSADGPTPHRAAPAERAAHLARLVEDRQADGVLVYVRAFDDAPLWDVAAQRAALTVPVVLIADQEYGRIDPAELDRALRTFEGAGHGR